MSMRVYFDDDPCPHCKRFDDCGEEQITYNYNGIYYKRLVQGGIVPDGVGEYAGKLLGFVEEVRGAMVAPILERAVAALSRAGEGADDYWAPTEGNTRAALQRVLDKCKAHPNARLRTSR